MREIVSPLSGIRSPFGQRRDPYKALGFKPTLVADMSKDYFRNVSRQTFDDIFTHSRLGNATMVDSDGLLKWAPHNLLTYSEDFSNAAWNKINSASVTANSTTAPDGTETADTINLPATFDRVRRAITVSAVDHTFGIWLKGVSGETVAITADETTYVTVTLTGDWQFEEVTNPATDAVGIFRNSGLTASTVYAWGAHLYRSDLGGMAPVPVDARVAGSTTYVPTTSTAKYLPRRHNHVYNGSAWVDAGTLIETEARTNLNLYSEDLSNWSIGAGDSLTLTSGQGVGPDGNSSLYELAITDTTNENKTIYRSHAVTTNETYNISAFFKDVDQRYVLIRSYRSTNNWSTVVFDLQSGEVTQQSNGSGSGTISFASIEDCGEGLLRASFGSSQAGTTLFVAIDFSNSATPTLDAANGYVRYVGTPGVGLYAGFIQLEAASTPSSYIPTSGSTVTRAADTSGLTVDSSVVPWPTPKVIGEELVTNGTFDTDTSGWAGYNYQSHSFTISSVSGQLNVSNDPVNGGNAAAYQLISTVAGDVYRVTFDWVSGNGDVRARDATVNGTTLVQKVVSGAGSYDVVFVAASSTTVIVMSNNAVTTGLTSVADNISVKEINPLAVCIQMKGRMTYADEGAVEELTPFRWLSGTPRIFSRLRTDSTRTGAIQFVQNSGDGEKSAIEGGNGSYSPGVNVPFNIASRHGSTFINGAVDGVALTADLTPVALPDLSSTDLQIGYDFMGNIEEVRLWVVDIGDTGIAEASS